MKVSAGKRILMLIENSTYPLDIRVHHEATTLTEAGYQVSVICHRGDHEPGYENIDGVHVYRYPAPPQGDGFIGYFLEYSFSFVATFLYSLYVWVRRGFHIIHTANPPDTAVFIALFYRLFGKQFIFDHHDLAPDMYLIRSNKQEDSVVYKILLWMEKVTYRFSHHVIATNHSYKKVAIERGNLPEDRITVVRNGPALDLLRSIPPDPHLKQKGVPIIGYVGVMGPQDGLDYLLRALNHLVVSLNRHDFYCVIIGKGSALDELENLSTKLGLNDYVWFTGFIPDDDKMRYLSTIDIGVDPDPSNNFNDKCTMIKMMEYMALSKPIVAFDLPEHRVTAEDAALYAQPNDELDFARKIELLMDNPDLRKKMGKAGRARVETSLAWIYQQKNLLDAYDALINEVI